jgi:hypothetical protein
MTDGRGVCQNGHLILPLYIKRIKEKELRCLLYLYSLSVYLFCLSSGSLPPSSLSSIHLHLHMRGLSLINSWLCSYSDVSRVLPYSTIIHAHC